MRLNPPCKPSYLWLGETPQFLDVEEFFQCGSSDVLNTRSASVNYRSKVLAIYFQLRSVVQLLVIYSSKVWLEVSWK
jgi:hypothetical protein